jgi:DnaJ family protein C protein 7
MCSIAYLKLKKFEDAVHDLEHARNIDPRDREISEKLREAQLELKKSKRKDYYAVLEVSQDSTEDVIKRAYRKKVTNIKHQY